VHPVGMGDESRRGDCRGGKHPARVGSVQTATGGRAVAVAIEWGAWRSCSDVTDELRGRARARLVVPATSVAAVRAMRAPSEAYEGCTDEGDLGGSGDCQGCVLVDD